jgi:hypothetical protein
VSPAKKPVVEEATVDIEILAGNPDETDLAAITAVLAGVLEELAEEQGRLQQASGQSAWERSQRAVRDPIYAQPGAWRSFSG